MLFLPPKKKKNILNWKLINWKEFKETQMASISGEKGKELLKG